MKGNPPRGQIRCWASSANALSNRRGTNRQSKNGRPGANKYPSAPLPGLVALPGEDRAERHVCSPGRCRVYPQRLPKPQPHQNSPGPPDADRSRQKLAQKILDVEVPDNGWRKKHWASLQQAYRKAPYFARYEAELAVFFAEAWPNLADPTCAMLEWLVRAVGCTIPIVRSSTMGIASSIAGSSPFLNFTSGVLRETFAGIHSHEEYPGIRRYSLKVCDGSLI